MSAWGLVLEGPLCWHSWQSGRFWLDTRDLGFKSQQWSSILNESTETKKNYNEKQRPRFTCLKLKLKALVWSSWVWSSATFIVENFKWILASKFRSHSEDVFSQKEKKLRNKTKNCEAPRSRRRLINISNESSSTKTGVSMCETSLLLQKKHGCQTSGNFSFYSTTLVCERVKGQSPWLSMCDEISISFTICPIEA